MAIGVRTVGTKAVSVQGNASQWAGRTVFVTGCTGLLGCWLCRLLCDRGARVVGLARRILSESSPFHLFDLPERGIIVHGQVEDYDLLERVITEYEVEVVFHLAGQSQVSIARRLPRPTFETNIRGTWNVLEATRVAAQPIRVVIASSAAVYGESPELLYREDLPLRSLLPYDVSKICSELLARTYHHTYQLAVCGIRCSNLYGGGDLNFNRIVPGTIRSVLQGEPPVIKGGGGVTRDYLYVEDAAKAYLALAEAMDQPGIAGEVFNFGSEQPVSVLDVVEMILRLMDRQDLVPEVLGQASGDIPVKLLSSLKAKQRLGWVEPVSLEIGLQKTIDWYQNNWWGRVSS